MTTPEQRGGAETGWWVGERCTEHRGYHLQHGSDGTEYVLTTRFSAQRAADALNEQLRQFSERCAWCGHEVGAHYMTGEADLDGRSVGEPYETCRTCTDEDAWVAHAYETAAAALTRLRDEVANLELMVDGWKRDAAAAEERLKQYEARGS